MAAERLARAVAGSARGSGIVFEQRCGGTEVRLTARSIPMVPGILPEPVRRPRPNILADGARPNGELEIEFGFLVQSSPPSPAPRADGVGSVGPTLFPSFPIAGAEATIQTFWLPRGRGSVAVARRYAVSSHGAPTSDPEAALVKALLVEDWALRSQRPCRAQPFRPFRGTRDWLELRARHLPAGAWVELPPAGAARTVEGPRPPRPAASFADLPAHLAAFGATGSGKTSCLAEIGAEAICRGTSVVAVDLHGDLAPAIAARTPPELRDRILAIDVTERPVPGLDVLGSAQGRIDDRLAAHVVAALKRLSPDGEEIYWGFRLERIFDSFVRIAQEEGGSLVDLAELLSRPERREAARWSTRRAELAQFLEEVEPVARRQPEILWAAGARLSKVVLVPALRELLAPEIPGWSLEPLRSDGRSLLLRLPFAEIGPEAAGLAASLLLGRLYLEVARAPSPTRPVLFLLDEAHALSPRLLTEIVTEGRKFGVRAVVATQYPGRFAREVEVAVAGSVGDYLCFRIPPASAASSARWLGLDPTTSAEALARLPNGTAWRLGGEFEPVAVSDPVASDAGAWRALVRRSRPPGTEPGIETNPSTIRFGPDPRVESLLLAATVLGEDCPEGFTPSELIEEARSNGPTGVDVSELAVAWRALLRARWVDPAEDGRYRLNARGAAALGQGRSTGAIRETSEHRALLRLARGILARRGCRFEVVRQGRFDTTLPDGRIRLVPADRLDAPPVERAAALTRAQGSWAWRFFGGRDAHVEAEVSGALRRERIDRGLSKARTAGAFALFLVADAERARRVRSILHEKGLVPDRAQVWTLSSAAAVRRIPPGAATRGPP